MPEKKNESYWELQQKKNCYPQGKWATGPIKLCLINYDRKFLPKVS